MTVLHDANARIVTCGKNCAQTRLPAHRSPCQRGGTTNHPPLSDRDAIMPPPAQWADVWRACGPARGRVGLRDGHSLCRPHKNTLSNAFIPRCSQCSSNSTIWMPPSRSGSYLRDAGRYRGTSSRAVGLKIILVVDETYSESIEFPAASMMGVRCRQRCAEPMSSCKAKRRQRLIIDGAAHRKPFFSKASPSYFSAHSPSMKET